MMTLPVAIAVVGMCLSLMTSIGGAFAVVIKFTGLVTTIRIEISSLRELITKVESKSAAIDKIPAIELKLDTLVNDLEEQRRRTTDFPTVRAKFDSLVDTIEKANVPQMRERLAVVEKVFSNRGMQAVRDPRKDDT